MPEIENQLFKVGDGIPGFNSPHDSKDRFATVPKRKTVLEIIPMPKSEKDRRRLVGKVLKRYFALNKTGVTVVEGSNLADDPRIADSVDPKMIYVLEI